MNGPVAITVYEGTVEDWIIENRVEEHNVFHIHQIHFLLVAENGIDYPITSSKRQYYDSITIPGWSGIESDPYPSVKIRISFIGQQKIDFFMYHCHILEREDKGMLKV